MIPVMTPLDLLDAIEKDMEATLADCGVLSGEPWRVFKQNLPPRKSQDDELPCPYCQIGLGDGEDTADESTQDVVIILGTRDNSPDRQGYRDVINAIQHIRQHYNDFPRLQGNAEIKPPIRWVPPQDDLNHPFYFGALLLTFSIPGITPYNPNI